MNLILTANNPTEKRVLDYLVENASEVLVEKINAGKKTLAGALAYAKDEAKKLAQGAGCVCVEDATVFGWIIHYFEEDSIEERQERKTVSVAGKARRPKGKTKVRTTGDFAPDGHDEKPDPDPDGVEMHRQDSEDAKKAEEAKKPQGPVQMTMFDSLLGGGKA